MRLATLSVTAITTLLLGHAAHAQKGDKGKPGPKGGAPIEMESAPAGGGPPSKTLDRAIKLYDKEDFFSASIELKKVLDGETQDDAKNKQRAEFFMGKTLFNMGKNAKPPWGFYAASLDYFEKIVKAGDAHTYHGAALKWLAALSRVLPETSGILELIGTYDEKALEDSGLAPVRDELYFLLGRHFYRRGDTEDFNKAIALFQKVSRQSEFFIKAKFFEGVTHVRKYDGRPAVDAFKEILVIGQEKPPQYKADDIADYNELAQLQMARVFYSTQQFDKSIRYFEKLDQNSYDWAESLFEASWAYFMKSLNSKALGNIHTLNAPYFENQFYPESLLLKSVIYYKYCLYDQAEEAIEDYNSKYLPLQTNLDALVKKYDDNVVFYDYVKKVRDGKSDLDPVTNRLVLSVLNDKTLLKTFAWVDELNAELQQLERSDKAWQTTAAAGEVRQSLVVSQSDAAAKAGKVARDRILRLSRELGSLARDGKKIRFQIFEGKSEKVQSDKLGVQISGNNKEEPIVVDDEHFAWRFNGEYWKDELGYYRFKIRSRCAKGQTPQ